MQVWLNGVFWQEKCLGNIQGWAERENLQTASGAWVATLISQKPQAFSYCSAFCACF